jgi:hypothetical protein
MCRIACHVSVWVAVALSFAEPHVFGPTVGAVSMESGRDHQHKGFGERLGLATASSRIIPVSRDALAGDCHKRHD